MKILPGKLDVYVHETLHTNKDQDPLELNASCYSMIYKKLEEYTI